MATSDFSVADVADNVIDILASSGDNFLGGSDIDNIIKDWVVEEFKNESGVDLSNDLMSLSRIVDACEKAKIELSSSLSTEINLPYITVKDNTPIHLTKEGKYIVADNGGKNSLCLHTSMV